MESLVTEEARLGATLQSEVIGWGGARNRVGGRPSSVV